MKRFHVKFFLSAIAALLPAAPLLAQPEPKTVPAGGTVQVTVTQGTTAAPPVSITLHGRHGHVTPCRQGCTHTGGGNTDVAQPSPDTLVITMTGAGVATGSPCGAAVASMDFDFDQCFEVTFDKPEVKQAKLTIEGRVIGVLRSSCPCLCKKSGMAAESDGCATVGAGPTEIATVCVPSHAVSCGENLSINDHDGPCSVQIGPGKYTLHQLWHIAAEHPCSVLPCKPTSAEFAPDPAIDPLWISYWEPFHGVQKKDFGFQVTIKVAPDDSKDEDTAKKENDKGSKEERLPSQKPAKKAHPSLSPPNF